jgi:acyl-CoA synthetase (AMP-forming)/AMP-acid ligase II
MGTEECIWSRQGVYNWDQTHERAVQYAQYFISKGIKPGESVAMYLQNSPEFMFIWLGLFAIGCSPAMINYNLTGEALLHCVKISKSKLMIVDDEFADRVAVFGEPVREMGIEIVVLSEEVKSHVNSLKAVTPGPEYRKHIKGSDSMCLLYTRWVSFALFLHTYRILADVLW